MPENGSRHGLPALSAVMLSIIMTMTPADNDKHNTIHQNSDGSTDLVSHNPRPQVVKAKKNHAQAGMCPKLVEKIGTRYFLLRQ